MVAEAAVSLKKASADWRDGYAVIGDQISLMVILSDSLMKLAAGHPPKSRHPRRRLLT